MQIKSIKSSQLPHIKEQLLKFINFHGDKRITKKGIRWLTDLSRDELKEDGNSIIIASEKKQLIGFIAVSNFGINHSFIAVHNDYRRKGTAKLLLKKVIKRMGRFYARIALDNIPSLRTCISTGMVAFKIEKGPTGKPTILMRWGPPDKQLYKIHNT